MKFPPSYQMDQYTKYVYVRNYVKLHILKKNNSVSCSGLFPKYSSILKYVS